MQGIKNGGSSHSKMLYATPFRISILRKTLCWSGAECETFHKSISISLGSHENDAEFKKLQ